MTDPKKYKTGANFRQALERRLQEQARQIGRPVGFVRKRVCFERFLARLFKHRQANWAVKGGYRLELAFAKARTTKDIDLVLSDKALLAAEPQQQGNTMLALLQEVAGLDMADFFEFQVSLREPIKHATIGGARFSVRAVVAGREFETFRIDVVLAETDKSRLMPVNSQNWLDFAGIEPPTIYAITEEYQFAEKLHAYTYPWETVENTRVKDLLDMLMLIRGFSDLEEVARAVSDIFSIRGKQPIPEQLTKPPESWRSTFDLQAADYGFEGTMEDCYAELSERYVGLQQTEALKNNQKPKKR